MVPQYTFEEVGPAQVPVQIGPNWSFLIRKVLHSGAGPPIKEKPRDCVVCDPAGTRTQDPYIKSVLLYQLSYEIIPFCDWECKNKGRVYCGKTFAQIFF